MNKRSAFQIAAVVGIVAIACVLYNVVPHYKAPTLIPPEAPPPVSALFQANLLHEWEPPNAAGGMRRKKEQQDETGAGRDAAAFLAVSGWAAQPQLPLPLGPGSEIAAPDLWELSRLVHAVGMLKLALLEPGVWDRLGIASAVGTGGGLGGPLSAAASLLAEPDMHALAFDGSDGFGGGIVVWGTQTTNISTDNGSSRKRVTDRFRAGPREADQALRAFRERLQEKVRQLGADVHEPAETVRDNVLVGFAFDYTTGSTRGRVAASVEPVSLTDHQLVLEIQESPQ